MRTRASNAVQCDGKLIAKVSMDLPGKNRTLGTGVVSRLLRTRSISRESRPTVHRGTVLETFGQLEIASDKSLSREWKFVFHRNFVTALLRLVTWTSRTRVLAIFFTTYSIVHRRSVARWLAIAFERFQIETFNADRRPCFTIFSIG